MLTLSSRRHPQPGTTPAPRPAPRPNPYPALPAQGPAMGQPGKGTRPPAGGGVHPPEPGWGDQRR